MTLASPSLLQLLYQWDSFIACLTMGRLGPRQRLTPPVAAPRDLGNALCLPYSSTIWDICNASVPLAVTLKPLMDPVASPHGIPETPHYPCSSTRGPATLQSSSRSTTGPITTSHQETPATPQPLCSSSKGSRQCLTPPTAAP